MKRIFGLVALAAGVLSSASAGAQNLVVNGSFEQVTNPAGVQQTTVDNRYINSPYNPTWGFDLPGWTNRGYVAVVYGDGVADDLANHQVMTNNGARASGNNVLASDKNLSGAPSVIPTSPDGGNFFGSNGHYNTGSLTQNVHGFVVGQQYELSFWSAAAVNLGGAFPTGAQPAMQGKWDVTLTGATTDVNLSVVSQTFGPYGGYSDWVKTTVRFTASSVSELLSFAPGTRSGPPMDLLDGVSIVAVPEPAEWALMGVGLLLIGARLRARRGERA
ncbi:hypothetical protein [Pelomonas sp. KK5]|uniref:hypothetical protein n=1 Tax=Pelomonas sp. KK5 TaxID=1855730 RepID=UPI00097C4666|nr:hypothetical protein [Pelomonas sp. KK5]